MQVPEPGCRLATGTSQPWGGEVGAGEGIRTLGPLLGKHLQSVRRPRTGGIGRAPREETAVQLQGQHRLGGGLAGRGFAERGCPEHLIGGREARVAAGGVLGAVAGGVAAHHLGAGVAEQVLDVEFAGRPAGWPRSRRYGGKRWEWQRGTWAARPRRRSSCLRPLGWSRTPGRSCPGAVTAHTSGPGVGPRTAR